VDRSDPSVEKVIKKFFGSESRTILLTLEPQGLIVSSNGGMERIFGLPGGFSMGRNIFDFILPENRDRLKGVFETLTKKSPPESPQCPFRKETLNFRHSSSAVYTMACFFSRCGGTVVLIGETRRMSDSEIIIRMTDLNNELASLSRELTRKNVELERANATINRLLNTDHLTGIANRRALLEFLAEKIEKEDELPLSLVMADIDHFKKVNDSLGHSTGDEVLSAFGKILSGQVRERDLCGRYGGEEFLIVLPRTEIHEAESVAERVRTTVEEAETGDPPVRVTASFGVAVSIAGGSSDDLIGRADKAMYRAKALGRNRVVTQD